MTSDLVGGGDAGLLVREFPCGCIGWDACVDEAGGGDIARFVGVRVVEHAVEVGGAEGNLDEAAGGVGGGVFTGGEAEVCEGLLILVDKAVVSGGEGDAADFEQWAECVENKFAAGAGIHEVSLEGGRWTCWSRGRQLHGIRRRGTQTCMWIVGGGIRCRRLGG